MKFILGSTPNLRSLEMNFRYDYRNTPFRKYVPNGTPPFSLRRFVTDHDGSLDLCAFLKTQSALEEMYLGLLNPNIAFHTAVISRSLPGLVHLRTFNVDVAATLLKDQKIEQFHFLGHVVELFNRLHGQQFPTVKALSFTWNQGGNNNIFASIFPNVRHLQTYIVSYPRLLSCKSASHSHQSRAENNDLADVMSFSRLEALYLIYMGEDDGSVEESEANLAAVVLHQLKTHPTLDRVYRSFHDGSKKWAQLLRSGVIVEEGDMSSPFGSAELPSCTLWTCPNGLRGLSY